MKRAVRNLVLGGSELFPSRDRVAYWDLRSGSGQTVPDYFGGPYALQLGATTGVESSDPTRNAGYMGFLTSQFLKLAGAPIACAGPFTVVVRCKQAYVSSLDTLINVYAGVEHYNGLRMSSASTMYAISKDPTATLSTSSLAISTAEYQTLAYSVGGGMVSVRNIESGDVVSTPARFPGGTATFYVGTHNEAAYFYDGSITGLSLHGRVLRSDELIQVHRMLMRPFDWAGATGNLIVFDGDSLTRSTYPGNVVSGLVGDWAIVNHGTDGAVWSDLIAESHTLDAYFGSKRTKAILCVLAGTNDYAVAASVTYPKIVAYCQARQAAGWNVVVGTVPPVSTATAEQKAERVTLNNSIAANWATFADALADSSADTYIGVGDYSTQPAYWANAAHPNAAGYTVLASYFETAVETLL